MSNSNESNGDASFSASYLEDYLECLESLPEYVQRHISEIRRLDCEYFDGVKQMRQIKDSIKAILSKKNPADVGPATSSGQTSAIGDRSWQKRQILLKKLKYHLLQNEVLADCKLSEFAGINELVEVRTRQLEHSSKNIELVKTDNGKAERTSSPERPVRSIMRSFLRGDKDRFSSAVSLEDQPTRSEKCSTTVLCAVASEAEVESEAASPSTCSSIVALAEMVSSAAGSSRPVGKRPRRQKQFPDFVRMEHEIPNGGSVQNNGNGASSSTTNVTSTRSNKDRSSGASKPKKLKKVQQKPEGNNSTGGGGAGNSTAPNGGNKIKFSVPVDPDEPTYCLCEQVSYGEMIGCDNGDCDIEWFHFNCVSLTSKPKGRWYCPNCRGDRPNIMKQAAKSS